MSYNFEYDLVVYIGRFQPFHKGHAEALRRASQLSQNVLVLVGSAVGPRTIKDPWTFEERARMIRSGSHIMNLLIQPLRDYAYNDNKWIRQVGEKVKLVFDSWSVEFPLEREPRIAIIGHDKDHSSYYLNYFKQWDYIEMPAYPSAEQVVDATKIRQLMFTGMKPFIDGVLPEPNFGEEDAVTEFMRTDEFKELQKEWNYIQEYKKAWSNSPYPPTFVTTDAVVVQSGHILLIQRGGFPGKGQWAMPGGFIDQYETLDNCVIRELREETGLKVPEKVLRGSIVHKDVFDNPGRSTRGRTITHAYLFHLDDTAELPRVKGGDDAAKAQWIPIAEFNDMQPVMYEDHWSIIRNMLDKDGQ
jgi:bifunctional NMN adenylyltransferase/nudix hydrolase